MRALILVALVGCSYSPDSFSYPGRYFPGQRVTVGCLDISVDRRADLKENVAVIDYQFGNRCDDPVVVDLSRVPVFGRTAAGEELTLTPYDPRFEMRELKLDARQAGGEAIAYPTNEPIVQICVDAAALADAKQSRLMCFATKLPPATPLEEDAFRALPDDPDAEPVLEHEEVRP
ncbi:MAG: hypothetical protein M4D80_29895 [Myxococcota bacterium]|nr:hypothetical protein [Myxococcota bacterium]